MISLSPVKSHSLPSLQKHIFFHNTKKTLRREMEDLFSQFTFLSTHALTHNSFDPEDVTNLFELDSYKAWAASELENNFEAEKTEQELVKTEEFLESDMEKAMREFYKFEEEMNLECEREMKGFLKIGDEVWKMGINMENNAKTVANKYIEGAIRSGRDKMRSAWKGVNKVHPS